MDDATKKKNGTKRKRPLSPWGIYLRRLLAESEYTSRREFCAVAGITEANLYHIETGKTEPRLSTVRGIANALGISFFEVLGSPSHGLIRDLESPQLADEEREKPVHPTLVDYFLSPEGRTVTKEEGDLMRLVRFKNPNELTWHYLILAIRSQK